eukprot:4326051-Lingulodinium_polyedra.AAC.1
MHHRVLFSTATAPLNAAAMGSVGISFRQTNNAGAPPPPPPHEERLKTGLAKDPAARSKRA